ncbi:DNA-binding protein [Robertmurraya yapensis]|uniref:DNA-binding protein n=1 Tax=Bacillus yapensis TaxID=2492960 RepID=A0A3S0IKU0_9BACI|nr:helix-turn-helix domain-containing protein [Bacillus yapensis]RTR26297.1 DNA-binding protein [Bacillus yapensis]TKS93652.1 helix-turn-helix domain-containing protein [Bacillus yapensis]
MYSLVEVCKKLGLDRQTVQNMCEKGRFQGAYQNENGEWLIPEFIFTTTRKQDEKAEKILQHIERKNRGGRDESDVPHIPAKVIADFYEVTLEKVISWIKQGYLSGKQMEGEYLVPKEEFDYLKSKRDKDSTEEEIKKLLGSDYIEDWEVEIED